MTTTKHTPPLTLRALRRANNDRQAAWPGMSSGSAPGVAFRALELAGEAGEVANVAKKLERERLGWGGSRATLDDLADELGDVVICADLLASAAGIDLDEAVRRKFDAVSDRMGLPHRLTTGAAGGES